MSAIFGNISYGDKMTLSLLECWKFEPKVQKNSEILCPECDSWSHYSEWELGFIDCELCGEHDAIRCPECFYGVDFLHMEDGPLKTRLTTEAK